MRYTYIVYSYIKSWFGSLVPITIAIRGKETGRAVSEVLIRQKMRIDRASDSYNGIRSRAGERVSIYSELQKFVDIEKVFLQAPQIIETSV